MKSGEQSEEKKTKLLLHTPTKHVKGKRLTVKIVMKIEASKSPRRKQRIRTEKKK